jgi:prevent-host-death family protein
MAHEIPVTQARAEFADLVNRVVYGGERVVVTRHGRPLVALISAADLERLEALDAAEPMTVVRLGGEHRERPQPQAPAEPPRRFGIAATHHEPGRRRGRDVT